MSTQLHPNIEKGMAQYNSEKPAGDIDLVMEVRNLLSGIMPETVIAQGYDSHRFIQQGQGKISHVQMFQLNRFWFNQFCACTDNMNARLGLLPDATPENWLKVFKAVCIPFINKHNLPIQMN